MNKVFKLAAGTVLVLLFTAGLMYAQTQFSIEPTWIWLGVILIPPGAMLIRKYPLLPLVALLFVGSYKSQAARGISFTDPTLIITILLVLTTGWELLLILSGIGSRASLRQVFQGQGRGVLAFVVFVSVLAISYLYTPSPGAAAEKLMRFAVFETLVFFAPFFLLKNERDFRMLVWFALAFAIPLSFKLIIGVAHPTEQQLLGNADVTRIGTAQVIGIVLLILLYYRLPGRFGRQIALVALPILAIGFMASIARGPILTFVIVIAITTVLLPRQAIVSRSTLILTVLGLAIVMAAALFWIERLPVAQNRGPGKIAELSALAHGTIDAGGTTSKRLDYYRSTIVAFSQHPFTGVGLAGWPAFYGDRRIPYPHDFILETAAEQGIVGLLALLALLGAAFSALSWVRKSESQLAFVIPVFLLAIMSNLFSNGIENRTLFFCISALFVAARTTKQKEIERSASRTSGHLESRLPRFPYDVPDYASSARRLRMPGL